MRPPIRETLRFEAQCQNGKSESATRKWFSTAEERAIVRRFVIAPGVVLEIQSTICRDRNWRAIRIIRKGKTA